MKWMEWISGWFKGETKSLGSLGVGLRAALSGGIPGGWASDHREETNHNIGFNYIAIHAIAAQVAGATVTVFADGDHKSLRRSRRKSLASRTGSFARWKSIYGADDQETDPLPTSHPLVQLLKRPNPQESGANFRYRQAQQIRLTGTCLIWNVPSLSGAVCERYVIPTAMASPVAPTSELPHGGWRISPVASRYTPIVDDSFVDCPSWYRILGQVVDARQMQVVRLPHAWYLDDGQSPLSAGAKWIDAGDAADTARYHQLKNGIDPSVVWNLPPDVSPDQDEIDRVQAKISAKYGGPENVGRVMVAQSGTSITPLSVSPKEMCYSEGFQDFKAAILALHQTPPVAVGLQEPGAYAAYNASMKAWRHAAIQPLCDMLAESDTEYLAPQFGEGLTVEIESDTVDDTELVELQLQNDLAARVRTRNEWRAVRGMPPLPGSLGDELVGTDSNQSAARAPTENSVVPGNPLVHPTAEVGSQAKSSLVDDVKSEVGQHQVHRRLHVAPIDNPSLGPFSSELNEPPNSPKRRESADDDVTRSQLIAEILYGLFGQSALSVLEAISDADNKTFDPSLHPRDEQGRFTIRGSAEQVAAARRETARILRGEFAPQDSRVLEALRVVSTSQLRALHREHGVTVPPRLRDHLIESVWTRLFRLPDFLGPSFNSPISERPPTNHVDVYVQNPGELDRIVKRKMSRQQWGQLVGAQPGSRVYVFQSGTSGVHVNVEHADYRALRVVKQSHIINSQFDVVPAKQGLGIATRVLVQEVEAASKLNFKYLIATAIGTGAKLQDRSANAPAGYYTWARLGYEGRIAPLMRQRMRDGSDEERATVVDFRKKFPGVKLVSEMMLTAERREWWREFGGDFEATFELGTSSISWRVLNDYLRERASAAKLKSLDVDSVIELRADRDDSMHAKPIGELQDERIALAQANSKGELPDDLTAEDEAILDRVWDQIAQEYGVGPES